MHINISIQRRFIFTAIIMALTSSWLTLFISHRFTDLVEKHIAATVIPLMLCSFIAFWMSRVFIKDLKSIELALFNLQDKNFSISIPDPTMNEFKAMIKLLNRIFHDLRNERQSIYQKELMLDKVMQNSPMSMVLSDHRGIIIYNNLSAQKLFNKQHLTGSSLQELSQELPDVFYKALESGKETLFHVEANNQKQIYHYSSGRFTLHTKHHHLHLFKNLTREITREEVATWKKSIRVITHELNNSLAPISSMLHSAKLLINAEKTKQLKQVLESIGSNIKNLHSFIEGYGAFARLPLPQKTTIEWESFISNLREQYHFSLITPVPNWPMNADISQLQQVIINVLKNAHESGSSTEDVKMSIHYLNKKTIFEVEDNGPGMTTEVLQQALVPFYSTKPLGSGLGLALCHEIIEAHHGEFSLHNLTKSGLMVRISLP